MRLHPARSGPAVGTGGSFRVLGEQEGSLMARHMQDPTTPPAPGPIPPGPDPDEPMPIEEPPSPIPVPPDPGPPPIHA